MGGAEISMKDVFKDLVGLEGVHAAIVLDPAGSLVASRFSDQYQGNPGAASTFNWEPFILELGEHAEADFVYDQGRIYLRKLPAGFLLVIMNDIAPISMVRLNCEILLPELDGLKGSSSRIGRILKKRIF